MLWCWFWKRYMILYCFVCLWLLCIGYIICVWMFLWLEECWFYCFCYKCYIFCNFFSGEILRIFFFLMKYLELIYYYMRSFWWYMMVECWRFGLDFVLVWFYLFGYWMCFYVIFWLVCDVGIEFWLCCFFGNLMMKCGYILFCEIICIFIVCNKCEIKIIVLFFVKIK